MRRLTVLCSVAIALVSHAASYIFSTLLGLCGLWYCGVSLASLRGTVRGAQVALPDRAT